MEEASTNGLRRDKNMEIKRQRICGKTTVLSLLGGLDVLKQGKVLFVG